MTIAELFQSQGLRANGPLAWRAVIPCEQPGVYAVSLSADPACDTGLPAPVALTPTMRARWLESEACLYVGKAGGGAYVSNVQSRVALMYQHHYGKSSPHRGGQDVHKLLPFMQLWLFWSPTEELPRTVEKRMLDAFRAEVGQLPFANRQA